MTTTDIYEILNDFISFRDPTQILGLATNLEIFVSSSFSDGKVHKGVHAPDAFRTAINRHTKSEKYNIRLGETERVGDDKSAVFIATISGKRVSKSSLFTLNLRDKKLISFIETEIF